MKKEVGRVGRVRREGGSSYEELSHERSSGGDIIQKFPVASYPYTRQRFDLIGIGY
jgi:hypothetical protein